MQPLSLILLPLAVGALAPTAVTRRFFDRHFELLRGRPTQAPPADQWFNQTLDHFDVLGGGIEWPQRFWVNATFFRGGASPVFLYVEGEGSGSPYDVVSGEHVELAASYGALLVALEHVRSGRPIARAVPSTCARLPSPPPHTHKHTHTPASTALLRREHPRAGPDHAQHALPLQPPSHCGYRHIL